MSFDLGVTNYFFPEAEQKKESLLEEFSLSGEESTIPISSVDIPDENITPIFSRKIITAEDFSSGYSPLFLGPSSLNQAAAHARYRQISIGSGYILRVSSKGELVVPKELEVYSLQFQQAGAYFKGLTGSSLNPDVAVKLDLRREVVKLPGYPPNGVPHCDYSYDKKADHRAPPQIYLLAASFVGTHFYPDVAFQEITRFTEKGATTLREAGQICEGRKAVTAPAETWLAATDLHVHAAPYIALHNVPESEQFDWEKCDDEGVVSRGKACFRNFMYLGFERK